jgi:hypothetical protein
MESTPIVLLHLSSPGCVGLQASTQLRNIGWDIYELHLKDDPSLSGLNSKSIVLVLSELCQPLLAMPTETQWNAVQTIIKRQCNLLWVSQGSQMKVDSPMNAVCHGVFRTVRAEEPQLRLITPDVESSIPEAIPQNIATIDRVLRDFSFISMSSSEYEYVERHGLLYISWIWPDEAVNRANLEVSRTPVTTDLMLASQPYVLPRRSLALSSRQHLSRSQT